MPEFDLVLGGHDHHHEARLLPGGCLYVKSGTDFKDLTRVTVTLPPPNGSSSDGASGAGGAAQASARPTFEWQHLGVPADAAEDPAVAQVLALKMGGGSRCR